MIRFGPSGHSASFYAEGHKHTPEAAKWLRDKGLNAYEYSFGRGVSISQATAEKIGAEMREYDIALSCHAPYYINLAHESDEEVVKSFGYIERCIEAVKPMGGERIVFHPGSASKGRAAALQLALKRTEALLKRLDGGGYSGYILCPETMGKKGQLGTCEEICEMCRLDGERLIPTFDWGHINAYYGGSLKSAGDYRKILDYVFSRLTERQARFMHIHFSKIQYGQAGEIRHLDLTDTVYGPDFEPLAGLLKEYKMEPVVICESRENMAEDALKLKAMYENLL
ncbi:MAG: TIM barrel protein [Clostridiales bacterium]|jgi:deoxyribonuclease-4|nr:TIM barrel protein [Clostridiales bacterium]